MLIDVMEAITLSKLWDWLHNYPQDKGFMFVKDKELNKIRKMLIYKDHNEVSFGIVMAHMEYIAKRGWGEYVNKFKS